jgi:hypothetical protein
VIPIGAVTALLLGAVAAVTAVTVVAIDSWREVRVAELKQPPVPLAPTLATPIITNLNEPGDPCPANLKQRADYLPSTDYSFSCTCTPDAITGPVWGSGAYTSDSSLCAAARHAGVIPAEGGRVHVAGAPACPSYPATSSHGVESSSWGPWSGSFYFPQAHSGACSAP